MYDGAAVPVYEAKNLRSAPYINIFLMEESVPHFEMQIEIIQECTDLNPVDWIRIYAEKFRKIMDEDPTLTKHQVKYALYFPNK